MSHRPQGSTLNFGYATCCVQPLGFEHMRDSSMQSTLRESGTHIHAFDDPGRIPVQPVAKGSHRVAELVPHCCSLTNHFRPVVGQTEARVNHVRDPRQSCGVSTRVKKKKSIHSTPWTNHHLCVSMMSRCVQRRLHSNDCH
jgi:hypothetical protein